MPRAVVTGGGGSWSGAHPGSAGARLGGRRPVPGHYPELEALGAESLRWDLSDRPGLSQLLQGADAVFHTAAKAGVWGSKASYWAINVDGTRRILEACLEAGVPKLIHTSSPSCTFDGGDHEGVREEHCPYPQSFLTHYPETKAEAEAMVLVAHGERIATVALRPHLIWGPGDPHLLPRVLDRHRAGRLAVVGSGRNRVGLTYIDNAVEAQLAALERLGPDAAQGQGLLHHRSRARGHLVLAEGDPDCAGRASAAQARARWPGLRSGGDDGVDLVAAGLEQELPMTRFVVSLTSHWYDLQGAREEPGYEGKADPVGCSAPWTTSERAFRLRAAERCCWRSMIGSLPAWLHRDLSRRSTSSET